MPADRQLRSTTAPGDVRRALMDNAYASRFESNISGELTGHLTYRDVRSGRSTGVNRPGSTADIPALLYRSVVANR